MVTTKIAAKHTSWKEALHQTCIRSLKVAPKRVAEYLGISVSTLSHACDENQPDNLSSKHLSALAQIPEIDLSFLDYLESLAGRLAITVPADTGAVCTTRMTAQAMHAMASLLDVKAEALEDGRISDDDARDIREQADNVTRCVQAIAAYAERVAQPEREQHAKVAV
jgi:hypothetical protein